MESNRPAESSESVITAGFSKSLQDYGIDFRSISHPSAIPLDILQSI